MNMVRDAQRLFIAFLLVALAYCAAARRWAGAGGGRDRPCRMVTSDQLLHRWFRPSLQVSISAILRDRPRGAGVTIALGDDRTSLLADVGAVLHIFPLPAHLAKALDVPMHPIAYLTMQVAVSWLLPPLLIFGTFRHQRRLAANGSDPSWHGSLPRWIRSAAKR